MRELYYVYSTKMSPGNRGVFQFLKEVTLRKIFSHIYKWPRIVPTQYLNLVSSTNSIYNIYQRTLIRFHTIGTTSNKVWENVI